MNSKKLMRLLGATSYDLPEHCIAQQDKKQTVSARKREKISIQEAAALYLPAVNTVVPPVTQNKIGQGEKEKSENTLKQYMAVVEVCRIANQRRQDGKERVQDKEKRHQRKAPGIYAGSKIHVKAPLHENDYDKLDVNRSEHYLLYSYDKKGTHSILGEENQPGSYGDRITNGDFTRKA